MSLIDKVLTHTCFKDKPPVLFDIGASGAIHYKWKKIAKYAVCVAFDADSREFNVSAADDSGYKKLLIFNSLISDKATEEVPFYLTRSPFCSSMLKPLTHELKPYTFASYFEPVGETKLKSTTIPHVLSSAGIQYIDWFKTDSQGIDLKLFKSIPDAIRHKIIVAEFEPGFIDAYEDEDKATDVIQYLKGENKMWPAEMVVKGNYRLEEKYLTQSSSNKFFKKLIMFSHQPAVGWAELLYLNKFSDKQVELRDYFLGWSLSTVLKQHGHALFIIEKAKEHFDDVLLNEMEKHSKRNLITNVFKFRFMHAVGTKLRKAFGKE